jgi:hypothetical protein
VAETLNFSKMTTVSVSFQSEQSLQRVSQGVPRMSLPTVVSIIESVVLPGAGVVQSVKAVTLGASELAAMREAARFEQAVVNWISRIQSARALNPAGAHLWEFTFGHHTAFQQALSRVAAQEAFLKAGARAVTPLASSIGVAAGVILPVVGMVAVQVALGAGYYEAREKAKKEGYATGFARGFITGLLAWELRFTIDRFWDNAVAQNAFDESIPGIQANAHNRGLVEGRIAAIAKTETERKEYLRGLYKLTVVSKAGWTSRSNDWMEQMRARRVQIDYVIDLSTAAKKHGIVTVE